MKDSIIVASHEVTIDGKLSEESKLRVEKAVELFRQGVSNFIIMNGGPDRTKEFTDPLVCDVMKDHALGLGVSDKNILTQNFSYETVGEAYFVKELILAPKDWKNNIIVTSDYHIPRSEIIYRRILGPKYTTEFVGVILDSVDQKILDHELESLEIFMLRFGDIAPGDSPAIEEAVYTKHCLYSKIHKADRLRFYNGKL